MYELTEAEQAYFDNIVERHEKALYKMPGVEGVGVGFKEKNGKSTDTVSITVLVSKKNKRIAKKNAVPAELDGVPTDVVLLDEFTPQFKGLLKWEERGSHFDTVCGGIEIHNRNLCRVNATVLGCIVWDKATGDPLGLTAQHGIGYVHKKGGKYQDADTGCTCDFCVNLRKNNRTKGYLRTAKPGDPINQPNSFKEENGIGELFKSSTKLDMALFLLNNKRKIAPKIVGINHSINNPIVARTGMRVECSARHTHTKGWVNFRGYSTRYPNRAIVKINIDPAYTKTKNGDSGGLWLQEGTGRPIGIHTHASGKNRRIAIATCISHLKDFHPVTFQPPKFRKMVKSLKPYSTDFAKTRLGFCVFRYRIGDRRHDAPASVVKYDDEFKEIETVEWDWLRPVATGIAASSHDNKMFCAWRSAAGNRVQVANITEDLKQGWIKTFPIQTRFRPALCSYKSMLLMATTDHQTETVDVSFSHNNGKGFVRYDLENEKACSAPSLAKWQSGVLVAWVDKKTKQIALKQVSASGKSVYFQSYRKLAREHQVVGDPSLVSGTIRKTGSDRWGNEYTHSQEVVFLGFTTAGGGLTILESSDGIKWKEVPNTAKPSNQSPTLFLHEDRVIWTRQRDDNQSLQA